MPLLYTIFILKALWKAKKKSNFKKFEQLISQTVFQILLIYACDAEGRKESANRNLKWQQNKKIKMKCLTKQEMKLKKQQKTSHTYSLVCMYVFVADCIKNEKSVKNGQTLQFIFK